MLSTVSSSLDHARSFCGRNYSNAREIFADLRDRIQAVFRRREVGFPEQVIATVLLDEVPVIVIAIGRANQNSRVTILNSEINTRDITDTQLLVTMAVSQSNQTQRFILETNMRLIESDFDNLSQSTASATDNSHD